MRQALPRSAQRRSVSLKRKAGGPCAVAVDPTDTREINHGHGQASRRSISHWIAGITLDEHTVVRRNPGIEHERAVAILDLLRRIILRRLRDAAGRFICTWQSKRTD